MAWGVLVLGLAAVQLALLAQRFYYGNDDLLQFEVALEEGLSWEMLSLNVFQHFGPYNRLAHLAVAQTGMSPVPGLAFMVVNLVLLLLGCLWFMTELGLSTRRRVVALVLIGLSVTVSESGIWFDTSMHILPAIAMTFAICAAHVRGVRTGRARWHVLTIVLFLLGQLVQERPIFALPLAVLADVLLLWRLQPWRERLRRLWELRLPLAVWGVVSVGVAAWLQAVVVLDGGRTPGWGATLQTMLLGLTAYVLPALVNLPAAEAPAAVVQWSVLAGVLVVGGVLARLRRGNGGPLLFAAATFLLYYGFLKLSPLLIDTQESIEGNAARLHYAVYVVAIGVVGLVHLRLPCPVRAGARVRRTLVAAGLLLLVPALVVAGNAYLDRQWAATTEARAYLDSVRAEAPEWSDPDVTLVPLWAHPAMATSWAAPYARHDRMLDLVVPGFGPQDLGPRPVVIDDSGAVRPVRLVDAPGDVLVESGSCGGAPPRIAREVVVRADVRRTREPSYLVVDYRAADDVDVQVVTDPDRAGQEGYFRSELPRGERTRLIPIDDPDVRALVLSTVENAPVCVEHVRVVTPVLELEDGPGCRAVDRLGAPQERVPCR